MININASKLRDYFLAKYYQQFNTPYKSISKALDLHLLKNLLDRYGEDVVILAIDSFFNDIPIEKASINYFGTLSFFDSKYQLLIKIKPIIKYKRLLLSLSPDSQIEAKKLIDEFLDYSNALFLTREDIDRKQKIQLDLERLYAKRN